MEFKTSVFFLCLFSQAVHSSNVDYLATSLLENKRFSSGSTDQVSPFSVVNPISVTVAWMNRPPYIHEDMKLPGKLNNRDEVTRHAGLVNKSGEQESRGTETISNDNTLMGIFHEVVSKGLAICGKISEENVTVKYTVKPAEDLQSLDMTIVNNTTDLTMPVHGSPDGKYGGYRYMEVLSSPGVVLIMNKQQILKQSRELVLEAMKNTWPVFVLTLLLTGLAGTGVWILDTCVNPKEFPRSFTRGVANGIWWSFISMTTVGYGDKIPKSVVARMFGVAWILTGLTLCSFFTTTLTSALTTSSIKPPDSLLGLKVAVVSADSHAYGVGMKEATSMKVYSDFNDMYKAFVNESEVEGILADVYYASYFMDKINDSRLVVVKLFTNQHSLGFVIGTPKRRIINLSDCLSLLFKYRQRDVQTIILRHIHSFHAQTLNRRLQQQRSDAIFGFMDGESQVFKTTFLTLSIVFGLILVLGVVCEFSIAKCESLKLQKEADSAVIGDIRLKGVSPSSSRKTSH